MRNMFLHHIAYFHLLSRGKLSDCYKYVEVDDENYGTGEVVEEYQSKRNDDWRNNKITRCIIMFTYNVESLNYEVSMKFSCSLKSSPFSFWLSLFNCNDFHGTFIQQSV